MTTHYSFVLISIGNDIRNLLEPALEWLRSEAHPPATVVLSSDSADLRDSFASLSRVSLIPITSSHSWLFTSFQRSRAWSTVNLDANAPRLREVRLPRQIAHASSVLSVVDARSSGMDRPDFGIALWSHLVPPRLLLGARITGRREGLTAEIALARPPDRIVCIDQMWQTGPIALVSSSDLIAAEVIALALRDVRTARAGDLGGPWEDELVQRATEIGLGCTGPSSLKIRGEIAESISGDVRARAVDQIQVAAASAGVGLVSWK